MTGHNAKHQAGHAAKLKMVRKRSPQPQGPGAGVEAALSSFFANPMPGNGEPTASAGLIRPTREAAPAAAAAADDETSELMDLGGCSQTCMESFFPPNCWDDTCMCRSRLALRDSTICIATGCSASDQRKFLEGIGSVCGAAQSASLVRAAATVTPTLASSSIAATTATSSVLTSTALSSTTLSSTTSTSTTVSSTPSSTTRSRLSTSSTINSDDAVSTVISTIQPPPTANTFASDSSSSDAKDSSLSAGAIAGIAIAIAIALVLAGLCAWHTRRTLAGRTDAAKDYLRKSNAFEPGAFGAAATGGKEKRMSEKPQQQGQRMSNKVPMNADFWENVKRQSQIYHLPEPTNPFAPRSMPMSMSSVPAGYVNGGGDEQQRPAQTYALPSSLYAASSSYAPRQHANTPVRGASLASQQGSLPLPGSDTGLSAPSVPAKDRSSSMTQYATLPSSPLKPLILPSIQSHSLQSVSSTSSPPGSHTRARSGTGVLPSSPPLAGMEEYAEDLRRSRSASAAAVPLPPSRGSSMHSQDGRLSPKKSGASPIETIVEESVASAQEEQREAKPKTSFEGLAYLR